MKRIVFRSPVVYYWLPLLCQNRSILTLLKNYQIILAFKSELFDILDNDTTPEIKSYYPFGMEMPGRKGFLAGADYRYKFNGMETDKEVSGQGNSYTTQFRQYDPRLGRWKSRDPLAGSFPWQSPYTGMDNNPVLHTDVYGLAAETKIVTKKGTVIVDVNDGSDAVFIVKNSDALKLLIIKDVLDAYFVAELTPEEMSKIAKEYGGYAYEPISSGGVFTPKMAYFYKIGYNAAYTGDTELYDQLSESYQRIPSGGEPGMSFKNVWDVGEVYMNHGYERGQQDNARGLFNQLTPKIGVGGSDKPILEIDPQTPDGSGEGLKGTIHVEGKKYSYDEVKEDYDYIFRSSTYSPELLMDPNHPFNDPSHPFYQFRNLQKIEPSDNNKPIKKKDSHKKHTPKWETGSGM